jgi:hypothetical protein
VSNQLSLYFTSSEHAAFVGRYHVLDVDVGILPSVLLKQLQGLLDQVPNVLLVSLTVVNLVTNVHYIIIQMVIIITKMNYYYSFYV